MEVDLNRYCDLTANQVAFLRDPARAHPAARAAFVKDGLMRPDGELTPDGRKALEIAEDYLAGRRQPEPPVIIIRDGAEIRFAPDRQRGLNAVHFKALLALARWPGLAWRWLCSVYGWETMQKLWKEDYILGRPVRGAPQHLTWKGLEALEEALRRAGAEYLKQLELEEKR
jgi:hypothetical protein